MCIMGLREVVQQEAGLTRVDCAHLYPIHTQGLYINSLKLAMVGINKP